MFTDLNLGQSLSYVLIFLVVIRTSDSKLRIFYYYIYDTHRAFDVFSLKLQIIFIKANY